ncbi:maleylpyruvate isomerase family mycothiol-dependent enzyme [Aeromicrobium sp.]|uniref:maleylpyruvate isomerase family mycothiol-dependent enzyme n=1 Tax=Aeromicrobium sp. TaxID=1871063 RepID=UPI003C67B913
MSRIARPQAMRLARTEYDRMAAQLAHLEPDDWKRPTACPAWDVRQMACHMIGMAAMASNPREASRQQSIASADAERHGVSPLDALTALQVRERDNFSPRQIVDAARRIGHKAARGRHLTPLSIRRRTFPVNQIVNGQEEAWTIGYLIDVVLTRDPWMHRIDIARATGREPEVTSDHDGAIVGDVVHEWAERHGRSYRLELSGPAGGHFCSSSQYTGDSMIWMDAIEFCCKLAGRGTGTGLMATQVPF